MLQSRIFSFPTILLVVGLLADIALWLVYPWPLWLYVLNLAPGIVALPLLFRTGESRKIWPSLLTFFAIGLIFVTCWVNLAVITIPPKVTSPAGYRRAIGWVRHKGKPYVGHFPTGIPNTATKVRFFCEPKAPLSISCVELRYHTSPVEAKRVLNAYLPKANKVYDGGSWEGWARTQKGTPSGMFRNPSNDGFAPLPSDFKVLILHVKWFGEMRSVAGGNSYGVAVSLRTNEVIYWSADWFIS
jgi:hypothetical protein